MALWGVLVVVALTLRPLLPIDETRYLSVAWEMWLRHDWLVPHLNGSPYPDKPPFLFWGILLGWRVFGRQRVVAQATPAARGSSLSVPAREAGPAALAGRPCR